MPPLKELLFFLIGIASMILISAPVHAENLLHLLNGRVDAAMRDRFNADLASLHEEVSLLPDKGNNAGKAVPERADSSSKRNAPDKTPRIKNGARRRRFFIFLPDVRHPLSPA